MRRAAAALTLLIAMPSSSGSVAAGVVPRATARPMRIVSIGERTDQIVLALSPPGRVTSVTWLSRDPRTSRTAGAARRVGVNHEAEPIAMIEDAEGMSPGPAGTRAGQVTGSSFRIIA